MKGILNGYIPPEGIRGTILEKIGEAKQSRINERLAVVPLQELKEQAKDSPLPQPSFAQAIGRPGRINIIGEIKQASPSKGLIQPDFNPAGQALTYAQAGVSAISVLTEEDYFLGSDAYLREVKGLVSQPILRKDFMIAESQIYEARILGASAILLIAAMLDDPTLACFMEKAGELGLDSLVEVHTQEELERALHLDARIIGINNRDLKTFAVDLSTTENLADKIPPGTLIVAESGIQTPDDMRRVARAGANAVLIGESLMRAAGSNRSVRDKLQELLEGAKE